MADRSAARSTGPRSSRRSREDAGWDCDEPGTFLRLLPPQARPLSWLSPVPLWKSRNDVLARLVGDPTDGQRAHWVAERLTAGTDPDLTVRTHADGDRASFLLLGDAGEGDASQYCVVPGLLEKSGDTDFMIIASDVIYPAGGVNEYEDKFYRPYQDYSGPIYAVPGNHDWYDGLRGFMRHFCGVTPEAGHGLGHARRAALARRDPAGSAGRRRTAGVAGSLARSLLETVADRFFWRRPPEADEEKVARMRALRAGPGQRTGQPGPYFAIDAGPVLLVGIDTGITDHIDREQGEWLRRISRAVDKPKILVTGTPLYSDAAHHPTPIAGTDGTVDDIVRAPEHNYLAAIGGDRHNYQRYPVRMGDGRTIQYIVSGGGGAFLHDTHLIPKVELPGVSEEDFRCYPLRGDSLSVLSRTYQRRLGWLVGNVSLSPDQAAAVLADDLDMTPVREKVDGMPVSDAARRAYRTMVRLPQRFPEPMQEYVQRFFDRNEPPLFKSFLRVDADTDQVTISCYAATGCRTHELDPPLEDSVRCVRDTGGTWRWETAW